MVYVVTDMNNVIKGLWDTDAQAQAQKEAAGLSGNLTVTAYQKNVVLP